MIPLPDNRHEINVRVDSSLYQLESILESLQGLVQGGLASFFNDLGRIDPKRVERLKYLMGQLNQSRVSHDIGKNLEEAVSNVEAMASALQIGLERRAPVLESIFPRLVQQFNKSIQKQYDDLNQYVTELFSAAHIPETAFHIPALLRSTRADIAAQLSEVTRSNIQTYLSEFDQRIEQEARNRYADYFQRFPLKPPPLPDITADDIQKQTKLPTANTIDAVKDTFFWDRGTPTVDFKLSGEAVTNYTISKNQIGIGSDFAHLTPTAKNFLTQHELGHSIFTRFQQLFPQRFEQLIRSGTIGTWSKEEEDEVFEGVFGHEKSSPQETLADLYAYFMTNPRGMEKALPKQYEFVDQFLNREIFQSDVLNFAYSKIKPEDADKIRTLFETGQYTKTALAKQFGISRRQINRILDYENWAPPVIEALNKPPSISSVYLGEVKPRPIITPTPPKLITTPHEPQPIITPTPPPQSIITPTKEEVKKYSFAPVPHEPPPPREKPTQPQPVTNRALEMMNHWLEGEYKVSAQLLKETRDGRKDSQKQAFDLKHLLAISAEARLEAIKSAQESLEDIYVATGRDRPTTEYFIRENIAEDTRERITGNLKTLLSHQGLRPHQVQQITEKYMKMIQDSLPPPPTPPSVSGGWGDWSWQGATRSAGKYALNRLVGGAFNAMDVIVDKVGLALSDVLTRGMNINENLYYPLEMTMAGRMGRLMRAGMGENFNEEFATAIQQMWGQAVPLELAGTIMSNYTALLGSTSMENLINQILPLTNIARSTGMQPERFVQPVAGMLRMMPGRTEPQVYTQLSESIARSIADADLTKAMGTDELLKVFSTLSKNFFGRSAEITPEAVESAMSLVGYLTNYGAPGLQGAIGLENLAKLNQALQGKGATLTPLLYLGANFQNQGWGNTTMEKMVNIGARFAREGLFMRNEGTNEIFLFSMLRQIMEMTGNDQTMATAILSQQTGIPLDISKALFDVQRRLGTEPATSETLNTLVNAIVQGDQRAYEIMTKGTELEQMQYYQLLEANTLYEQMTKNTGQLPLQIAMQSRKQLSPLMEKMYSALAEGAQGNVRGAFNQLVQAFKEVPGIDREGAAIMAYSALRNAGMTPQSLMEGLQRALPQTVGTTIGAALGPTIASNISTILPIAIPIIVSAVGAYLTYNWAKDQIAKGEERKDIMSNWEEKVLPTLEESGKTEREIQESKAIYAAISNFSTNQQDSQGWMATMYQQVFKDASNETLESIWKDVHGTKYEETYSNLLDMYGRSNIKELNPNQPQTFQSISPLSEKPLAHEIPNKSVSYTSPQQVNNNTNYTFTINVESYPGEDIEQIFDRASRQIMEQIEANKAAEARNRNGGQQ